MKRRAFTLIELLIVVAIIGILAAIAVPNFLNAQINAKVSRMKSDLRSMGVAVEAYRLDYGVYPRNPPDKTCIVVTNEPLKELTTPISYLTTIPIDIFHIDPNAEDAKKQYPLKYGTCSSSHTYWYLWSWGPDSKNNYAMLIYDPSNGITSSGDLKRTTASDDATTDPQ